MKRLDDAIERLLMGIATRASPRGIAVLAGVLYGGIGLALPLALGSDTPWLVALNVMGTMAALAVILTWFAVQVQAANRRHLVDWTSDLRLLDAEEFEWFVGELYRRQGWTVEETGRQQAPDGAIDLVLKRSGERVLVQCKRWTSWRVGVDDVRAFAGALMREGLEGKSGIFVTLSEFSDQARVEAEKLGLRLIDSRGLFDRVGKLRRPEPCPICGAAMLLDRSPRGWWFRCVAAGCNGKRDLGSDPARAVELLVQPPTTTP